MSTFPGEFTNAAIIAAADDDDAARLRADSSNNKHDFLVVDDDNNNNNNKKRLEEEGITTTQRDEPADEPDEIEPAVVVVVVNKDDDSGGAADVLQPTFDDEGDDDVQEEEEEEDAQQPQVQHDNNNNNNNNKHTQEEEEEEEEEDPITFGLRGGGVKRRYQQSSSSCSGYETHKEWAEQLVQVAMALTSISSPTLAVQTLRANGMRKKSPNMKHALKQVGNITRGNTSTTSHAYQQIYKYFPEIREGCEGRHTKEDLVNTPSPTKVPRRRMLQEGEHAAALVSQLNDCRRNDMRQQQQAWMPPMISEWGAWMAQVFYFQNPQ